MAVFVDAGFIFNLLAGAVKNGHELLLMFDCDGTLAPIAPRPEAARVRAATLERLRLIENIPAARLAVISGRPEKELRAMMPGLRKTMFIGDHGAVISSRTALRKKIRNYLSVFESISPDYPGLLIEDKDVAAGLHYRNAAVETSADFMKWFYKWWLRDGDPNLFSIMTGKKVFEIRPRAHGDKGTAVLGLLNGAGDLKKTFALYAGDDTTDEAAFKALNAAALPELSATILVAETDRPTHARYRVESPAVVHAVLNRLCRRPASAAKTI